MLISDRLLSVASDAIAEGLNYPLRELVALPSRLSGLFTAGRFADLASGLLRQDPVPLLSFVEDGLSALLAPLQAIAASLTNLPARIGLQLVLDATSDELFPDVPESRVLTERAARAEAVYSIARIGLASRTASFKAVTNVGALAFMLESGSGLSGKLGALLDRQIGKYISKVYAGKIKRLAAFLLDTLLRSLFALACAAVCVALLASKAPLSALALRQDRKRVRLKGSYRTRKP